MHFNACPSSETASTTDGPITKSSPHDPIRSVSALEVFPCYVPARNVRDSRYHSPAVIENLWLILLLIELCEAIAGLMASSLLYSLEDPRPSS